MVTMTKPASLETLMEIASIPDFWQPKHCTGMLPTSPERPCNKVIMEVSGFYVPGTVRKKCPDCKTMNIVL